MHNMAIAMYLKGNKVSGSDDEIFEPAKSNLEKYGLFPEETGWHPEKITSDIDTVILGMHAKADNPELLQAQKLGLNIVSFPEFIYQNSLNKKRVVIGGSHGKTTVTSMILHVLKVLNIDVDYLVGAKIPSYDVMVKITDSAKLLVVEGDEYLSSTLDLRPKFHLYHPHIAMLTGIAWDHYNVFPTFDFYLEQFKIFIDTIEPGGSLIYFEADKNLRDLVSKTSNKIKKISYDTPDYYVDNNIFIIKHKGKEYSLNIAGKHNMQNLFGAMKVCNELDISSEDFLSAITSYVGAAKRMELIRQNEQNIIYRDFAHAPSKVEATVNAIREQYPKKKIAAIFELHTYSSLNKDFIGQYKNSLKDADTRIVFFDPHALGLKRLPALDFDDVRNAFGDEIIVINDIDSLKEEIHKAKNLNEVLLFMSSGNFGGINLI